MTSADSTLTVQLLRASDAPPLIEQLASHLRREIAETRLPPGSRLPSTRALAVQLEVSRTVTSEAYATLLAEGYLEARRGAGTFVVQQAPPGRQPAPTEVTEGASPTSPPRWLPQPIDAAAVDPPADTSVPFRICEPDAEFFPDDAWRRAARAAINEAIPEGYPPAEGDVELRQNIAAFLQRERGLSVAPDELLITSGTTQSLALIARAVVAPTGGAVAFEDPGYRLARQILIDHGARLRPVPVDDEGLQVEKLQAAEPPIAVYLTPSHQFPLGSALSYRRRLELLDWAAQHEVLLIEDDYDSEFRFDGPVLPSLLSSDRSGSVAYLGTFSKSTSPRLRLGYLIAPPPLREALGRLKVRADQGTSWLSQRVLARYLSSGAFTRHLRRMRRLYRRRRDALTEGLEPLPAGARWCGLAAGLHATLLLPREINAGRLVELCNRRGVRLAALESYRSGFQADPRPQNGLVLGYGASDESQIRRAVDALRWALANIAPE